MSKARFVSRQDAGRGFDLQVVDDAGVKLDWFITVLGVDSEAYRNEQREQQVRRLEWANDKSQRMVRSVDQIENEVLDLLVASTKGWRGDDQPFEFTREGVRKFYGDYPQVADQVDRAIHNRRNFLPGSGTS